MRRSDARSFLYSMDHEYSGSRLRIDRIGRSLRGCHLFVFRKTSGLLIVGHVVGCDSVKKTANDKNAQAVTIARSQID